MLRLNDIVENSLRAARIPGNLRSRILAYLDEVVKKYGVYTLRDVIELDEWEVWLILVKSIVSPISKMLRDEGYCNATSYLLAGFMSLDERLAEILRKWLQEKCINGYDPCCYSPRCCNIL